MIQFLSNISEVEMWCLSKESFLTLVQIDLSKFALIQLRMMLKSMSKILQLEMIELVAV